MEHHKLKQHILIHQILLWGGLILAVLASLARPAMTWVLWIGLAIAFGGLVYRVIFVKCPYCGDTMAGSRTMPRHCPNCGKELDT